MKVSKSYLDQCIKSSLIDQKESDKIKAAVSNLDSIVISGSEKTSKDTLLKAVVQEVNMNDESTKILLVEDHWGSLVEFFDETGIKNVGEFGVSKVLKSLSTLKQDKSHNYVFVFDDIFRKAELIYPMIDIIQEGFSVIWIMESNTDDFVATLGAQIGDFKASLITGSVQIQPLQEAPKSLKHIHLIEPEEE